MTFLTIGTPVGTPFTHRRESSARTYVWNPDGRVPEVAATPLLITRAELPASAADTGFRDGDAELWIDASDTTYLYRVDVDRVEGFVLDASHRLLCA